MSETTHFSERHPGTEQKQTLIQRGKQKMQSKTTIPGNRLEQFQLELDELYKHVLGQVGETDAHYIRRVVAMKNLLELGGRILIFGAAVFWNPVALIVGVLALSASQIIESMEIGHNVLHGQYDFLNDPKLNSKTYEWDVVVPAAHWKHSHNVVHHDKANIIGRDYDIGYGTVRITGDLKWNLSHSWQVLTALFMALEFQHLAALHDGRCAEFLLPKAWRPPAVDPRPPWSFLLDKIREYRRKAVPKVFRDYVFYPALAGPFFVYVLVANLAARALTNIWLFSVIFCGHFTDNLLFFKPEQCENECRGRWYLRQILSTGNIEGSALFYFMTGHLSHHIEHHLFPDIPGHRYPEMAVEVRKICARHGIPYATGPFLKQFLNVLKRIVIFSFPNTQETYRREPFDMARMYEKLDDRDRVREDSKRIASDFLSPESERIPVKQEVEILFMESKRTVKASTSESILASAELIGLSPQFGCRRGICHTCKVTKNSGRVLDRNTGIESGDGREQIRICVNSPLTDVCIEL
ncbi:MAG: fatty acid desaturase [Methylococcaceae bacterium]|nr:fatty acid desaturase [Methylococcaceae bacterium]